MRNLGWMVSCFNLNFLCKSNTIFLNQEKKKNLKIDGNENTTTQNLWDAAKAVLRGKFIAMQSYLKKQETSQINNLNLYLKQLENKEQKNPKVSRKKEIIKIRSEINEKSIKPKTGSL